MTPTTEEQYAPASILDQDLYKFCMQQAVLEHYPHVDAEYGFVNRDPSILFNRASFEWLQSQIALMSDVRATDEDLDYLRSACPYFSPEYMLYLSTFTFDPLAEVSCLLDEDAGALSLRVCGNWTRVMLYEVPLLALIAESHYRFVDTDWNYVGQRERIAAKGEKLAKAGCRFAEFGTRRRRSFMAQDIVVSELSRLKSGPGGVAGTSNVYLARKYGVSPVGTIGHEWIMGIAALENTYQDANRLALVKWHETYGSSLSIALPDTFGTGVFFANFDSALAETFNGVRHDSGDPFVFAQAVCDHYRELGIDPSTKSIIFSDSLTPDITVGIKQRCDVLGMRCLFGIGTNFTNDFGLASNPAQKSTALNIVIKLFACNGRPCVKLSDDKTKFTGNPDEVKRAQAALAEFFSR
ncbi:nicotinate phosphoribosyltransferase [Coemansia sp. BCRC 34301]|nr:nicotinate phosphoribosyltransferase [Coemansia sp. BCRC 34301]